MRELLVHTDEAGMKLLSFLEKRLTLEAQPKTPQPAHETGVPRTMLHRWIRSGQVRINGKRAKAFDRLAADDAVRIPPFARAAHPESSPAAESMAAAPRTKDPVSGEKLAPLLRVLDVTPDILVLEKASGLASQPGSGHVLSVAGILKERFRGAAYIPAPAHRLDRLASGIILAGRNFAAQRMLSEAFAEGGTEEAAANKGSVRKEYLAWVHGRWPEREETTLHDILVRRPEPAANATTSHRGNQGNTATPPQGSGKVHALLPGQHHPDGKKAACAARPLCFLDTSPFAATPATLMHIRLFTGRTHQIRVQFASRGYPLVGDTAYGGSPAPGILLHAARVTLTLPSGEERVFSSPPPWPEPFACGI